MQTGAYYLQTPSAAPASWTSTSGYELNAQAVPLNDGSTASFDLTAVQTTRNVYSLQSTGRSITGSAYTHAASGTITIARATIPGAGVFGGNIAIPKGATFSSGGVTGAVAIQANGTITAQSGSTISGTTTQAPLSATAYTVPTAATVNYYGVGMSSANYLCYDGVTLGTPQLISASSISSSSIPTANSGNPGAIFYHSGNLKITGTLTMAGTLIVRGGTLTISANTTITPKTGYPALVCENGATISGANRTVTLNGVVFIGGNYTWTGTNTLSKFIVNGALVMPASSTIAATNNGSFTVTYASSKANVPDLTTFDQPGLSVKFSNWNQ